MANVKISNLTTLWNTSSVEYNGIKLNITNTTSSLSSKAIDLQVDSTSIFNVGKTGITTANAFVGNFTGSLTGSSIKIYNTLENGSNVVASGLHSHAEGSGSLASGNWSHAEGHLTTASGIASHAEGYLTTAEGNYSHAEGSSSLAVGIASHAEGQSTTASANYQHVSGKFNVTSSNTNDLFIIGNGTAVGSRSNIVVVNTSSVIVSGNISASGHIILGSSPELLTAYPMKMRSDGKVISLTNTDTYISAETTGSFTSATYNYTIMNADNIRMGTIFSTFLSGSINSKDETHAEIGSTSEVNLSVDLTSTLVRFKANVTDSDVDVQNATNWLVKVRSTYI